MENLQTLISKLVKKNTSLTFDIARVDSVDRDNFEIDCTLLRNDEQYVAVPLSLEEIPTSVSFPAINSIVLIAYLDNFTRFVIQLSTVENKIEGNSNVSLKTILDFISDSQIKMMNSLIDAISQMSFNSPAGVTAVAPNNIVIFEQTKETFKSDLEEAKNKIKDLYYK
jgi:hypothetical protein